MAQGIGLAYYIPAGMFSTGYGGENAGVLSCYLDAACFAASVNRTHGTARTPEASAAQHECFLVLTPGPG